MKIFNKENNQEKVYVQMKDLKSLMYANEYVPKSIIEKKNLNIKNDEFVEFTDPEHLKFFHEQTLIVDYKQHRGSTKEEIKFSAEEILERIHEIEKELPILLKENNKEEYYKLYYEYKRLKQAEESFDDIYGLKQGYNYIPFPEVIDSDSPVSMVIDIPGYCDLNICFGLNPDSIIITKNDQNPFSREPIVDEIKKQVATTLILNHAERTNNMEDHMIKESISEDKKKIIFKLVSFPKSIEIAPIEENIQKTK